MQYLSARLISSQLISMILIGLMWQTPVSAEIYISDDFESGNLNKWFVWEESVVGIAKNIGGNPTNALHLPYYMPAGGDEHNDLGLYVLKSFNSTPVDHVFISGRFYSAPTDEPTRRRKLIYIKSSPWDDPKWDAMVSLFGGKDPGETICLNFGSNYYEYSDLKLPEWELACGKVHYGEWHFIEVELKLNTVGKKDGWARLWLDGNLEYERTGIAVRNDSKPFGEVGFGNQIDRQDDALPRHEDRYWDDITISSTYVGVGAKPAPPSNVK